ncbi:prolipoprotein diacylglyceryl transferase 1 [Sphaerisporangium melleum]|uniref:Phosphatidylglycerol--prolipoprotein diacylglyceryl transferase n=1 Tax=Sphaerisporangium melleum TaxID=321316 RepID=A0A917RIV2_9ACTN|nr:prolipoprotein diacylglyceryl transferase [Sphaerisporangium melleum]GGL10245.1 prolipoprotein diacylglyceryl transferase 1 [Sphaerisporangium melleum]GII70761.1 prolipoprotein diacylglyceryl transferase 1 [Sphaerisporangium melleum]
MPLASIPSPPEGVWYLGPIPLRAYAFCIVLGVIAAVWIGERRWRARGGEPGTITDLAVWAVPFGLVGGRLYHVISDWQLYFAPDAPNRPIDALYIWHGGLGIWGAIALGAVGVWIACRRRGISLSAVADAVAPGIAVAQAIGRWGNYFNQELFGGPTDLPWGLEIEPGRPGTIPGEMTYHPTFLYESLWDLALAAVLIWAGRRWALRHGRLFAIYVAGYTLGRFWIEGMRVDPAHHILGLRLNQWTSVVIFLGALVYLYLTRNRTTEEIVNPMSGAGLDPAHDAAQADEHEIAAAAAAAEEPGSAEGPPGEAGESASEPDDPQTGPRTEAAAKAGQGASTGGGTPVDAAEGGEPAGEAAAPETAAGAGKAAGADEKASPSPDPASSSAPASEANSR